MNSASDGELLSAFAEKRDEEAFAELVRRHGPLVFNLCRRVLGNSADAEDAAQAAFLALAREAERRRTIRSAAAWLHRVARNIALNSRASDKARERREKEAAAMASRAAQPAGLSDEQGALLHEEIDALPERYRQAVILCDLKGRSMEQAATIMAAPTATVGTWVLRGRERLRSRLARRGLVLSLAALTSLLSTEAGAVELPATFAASTTAAAAGFVGGNAGAGAGVFSTRSASLAEGALKKMSNAKLQLVALMVVLFLSIGAGTGWLVTRATSAEGTGTEAKHEPQEISKASKLVFRELDYMQGDKGQGNHIFGVVGLQDKTVRVFRSQQEWDEVLNRWKDFWGNEMGQSYVGYDLMMKYIASVPPQMKRDRVFEDGILVFLAHQAMGDHRVRIHDPVLDNRIVVVRVTDEEPAIKDELMDYDVGYYRWLKIKAAEADRIDVYINQKRVDSIKIR